ncbi:zinc finger B-box domain-containing protein 1 [Ambystoma mexicanum]|uniref:zinc finger B-box domain-containing protein 1 n=1 Tax=Ambystoma mexicanum TaxID=8296 RepID=UPI0037E7870F
MSTNDFVTSLKIGNVGKSKSKKLQELRLETMHLEMENQDMEQKLSQLRLNMDKEKEERQLSSGFRWKSGQVGSLNYTGQGLYQNKENAVKDYSGKMKFKVLKDSIPETGKQPAGLKPSFMASIEKPKTKGKACGQCENRNAVLSCLECGEDYCVCCFTKFHQKGALKLHRTSPIPGKYTAIGKLDAAQQFKKEIDLSLLKLDTKKERTNSPLFSKNLSSSEIGQSYSTEVKDVPIGKLDATQQFKKDIDLSLMKHDTRKERSNSPLLSKNLSPPGIVQSYSVESVSTLSTNPGNEKVPGGSLLHGTFNEDQSSKSFKEILAEWRKTNPEPKPKLKSSEDVPDSVGESEVQTQVTSVCQPFEIEFTQNSLNYMEKLLLKKHRRTPVDQIPSVQTCGFGHFNTVSYDSEERLNEEDNVLTAEEIEDHEHYTALFRTQSSQINPARSESSLKFTELNEAYEEDLEECSSFVVHEDSSDSCTDSVLLPGPCKDSLRLTEKPTSPIPPAKETRMSTLHSSYTLDKNNLSTPTDCKTRSTPSTAICSADNITFLKPEAKHVSPRERTDSSLRESADCSDRGKSFTQKKSIKLEKQKHVRSCIVPETTAHAPSADLSFPRALQGKERTSETSSFKNRDTLDRSASVNASTANQNVQAQEDIRQRGKSCVSKYRGLEGFFCLGVDLVDGDQDSYTPRKSEQSPADSGILCRGDGQWRPESSLSKYADDALVQSVVEIAWARPTSNSGRSTCSPRNDPITPAPQSARGYKSQRPLSAHTPRHNWSNVSRPASAVTRPLSRAASEIEEIACIDITEQIDPLFEDNPEQQELTRLEEELIELKSHSERLKNPLGLSSEKRSNSKKSSKKESTHLSDSHKMVFTTDFTKVLKSKEASEQEDWLSSSANFGVEFETDGDDEEQSRQDKKNVMSLS